MWEEFPAFTTRDLGSKLVVGYRKIVGAVEATDTN